MSKKRYRYFSYAIAGLSLLALGSTFITDLFFYEEVQSIRQLSLIHFALSCVILARLYNKNWLKTRFLFQGIAFSSVIVSLVFIFQLTIIYRFDQQVDELNAMNSPEKVEIQFAKDLEKGDLKWFQFGLGPDLTFASQVNDELGLDVWHMGCIVTPSYTYYNDLVREHYRQHQSIALLEGAD